MNEFEQALEVTTESLRKLSENGSNIRGSREALRRLAAAKPKEAPAASAAQSGPKPLAKPPAKREQAIPTPQPAKPASAEVFQTTGATRQEKMEQIRAAVAPCTKCPQLARTRTQTVFGVGNIDAEIMFVGEAPGADEDLQGEPFVGKAGQLLTKIIETMRLKRSDVFIANVLKCRPDMPPGSTGNRRPTVAEMQTCLPYLRAQIEAIRPKVLVALGSVAMEGLLGAVEPMARLRGRWHEFQGIPLMATYHPAYLLRNQSLGEKRKVWEDMLLVMDRVGLPINEKQRGYFLK
ncbi:MAG TPA: uracil-DNA glycosylase [Chthoniobacteraceae bacterium]|jgi:DNA polymerase|nr:uracil-DNA glycosylase [Chthoniobacteraceae bacterium]